MKRLVERIETTLGERMEDVASSTASPTRPLVHSEE